MAHRHRQRTGPTTKAEAAFHRIRDEIRTGQLSPGQRITLQGLAGDLDMSLTPVREALQKLAKIGFVVYKSHRYIRVAEFTRRDVEDIYALRMVLEPLAAELAAKVATESDLEAIETHEQEYGEALAAGDAEGLAEANQHLHRAIYAGAHNSFLDEFIERLWSAMPYQVVSVANHPESSGAEHRRIVAALQARNPAGAAEMMRAHIETNTAETLRRFDTPDTQQPAGS